MFCIQHSCFVKHFESGTRHLSMTRKRKHRQILPPKYTLFFSGSEIDLGWKLHCLKISLKVSAMPLRPQPPLKFPSSSAKPQKRLRVHYPITKRLSPTPLPRVQPNHLPCINTGSIKSAKNKGKCENNYVLSLLSGGKVFRSVEYAFLFLSSAFLWRDRISLSSLSPT